MNIMNETFMWFLFSTLTPLPSTSWDIHSCALVEYVCSRDPASLAHGAGVLKCVRENTADQPLQTGYSPAHRA